MNERHCQECGQVAGVHPDGKVVALIAMARIAQPLRPNGTKGFIPARGENGELLRDSEGRIVRYDKDKFVVCGDCFEESFSVKPKEAAALPERPYITQGEARAAQASRTDAWLDALE